MVPHRVSRLLLRPLQRFFVSGANKATTRAFSVDLKPERAIENTDARRKGLSWRAKQRGWLELDWLVGTFAEKHLANLSEEELVKFEEVLELENPDLFKWLTSQGAPPENVAQNSVYKMLAEYVNSHHPEIMRKMSTQNQNLS